MSKHLNKLIFIVFGSTMFLLACSKETSFESSVGLTTASGTLKDSSGNCQGISIAGSYVVDSVLNDSNYLVVTATITKGGTYKIYTDTANGYWFNDSSFVLTQGTQTFKLKGYGKPILPLTSAFTVHFNSSYCLVNITASITSSNGGGNGTTVSSGDYFPTTTGSYWTYDRLNSDSLTYTVSNITTTVSNKVYKVFISDHHDTALYRKDTILGQYFSYGSFASDSRPIEYKILDDKVALNSFWETDTLSTSTFAIPAIYKIRFTIDAKNVQYTINGNVIDSIIKVKQEILLQSSPSLFTIIPAGTTYSYYAKKIGLVWLDSPNYSPPESIRVRRWKIN